MEKHFLIFERCGETDMLSFKEKTIDILAYQTEIRKPGRKIKFLKR